MDKYYADDVALNRDMRQLVCFYCLFEHVHNATGNSDRQQQFQNAQVEMLIRSREKDLTFDPLPLTDADDDNDVGRDDGKDSNVDDDVNDDDNAGNDDD